MKTKEEFLKDIERIYEITTKETEEIYELGKVEQENSINFLDQLLEELGIEKNKETRFAMSRRITRFSFESLAQILREKGVSEKEIKEKTLIGFNQTKKGNSANTFLSVSF